MSRKIVRLIEWKAVKVHSELPGARLLYALVAVEIDSVLKTGAYVGIMQGDTEEHALHVAQHGTPCSFTEANRRFPGVKVETYLL